MRRLVVLASVLLVAMTLGAFSFIAVAGSGTQFARRLERNWAIGKLRLDEPRMADLDTVFFRSFEIPAPPRFRERTLLSLEDLKWRRSAFFERPTEIEIAKTAVRFTDGRVSLERRDGRTGGWNFTEVMAPVMTHWDRVPGSVSGRHLRVHIQRVSSQKRASLEFSVREPDLRREGDEWRFSSRAEGPSWGTGQLSWRYGAGGAAWAVDLDDIDLERFPIEALRRLFGFPFPLQVTALEGRADLDWNHTSGSHHVELKHFLASVGVPGLPHPIRYLDGRLTLTPLLVDWHLDAGVYSQSRIRGVATADLSSRRIQGEFTLEGVLRDVGIGRGLSPVWESLLAALSSGGFSELTIEVDGDLDHGWASQVRSARLEIEGATGGGDARLDSVTGVFDLSPRGDAWSVQGETTGCVVRGFQLPRSRWQGRAGRKRFSWTRSNDDPPIVRLTLDAEENHIAFHIDVVEVSMTQFVRRSLGEARATVVVDGEWSSSEGIDYRGWFQWHALRLPAAVKWPGRRPLGTLSGFVVFRCGSGLTWIRTVAVKDDRGLWVGRGKVLGDGTWDLEGVFLETERPLPLTDEAVRLFDFPPDKAQRFRLRGALWEWSLLDAR